MRKAGTLLLLGMLCFVHSLWAQNPVTGKVTDKNGTPIAGASVAVKNTSLATFTDENGLFTISAPARATLVITHDFKRLHLSTGAFAWDSPKLVFPIPARDVDASGGVIQQNPGY